MQQRFHQAAPVAALQTEQLSALLVAMILSLQRCFKPGWLRTARHGVHCAAASGWGHCCARKRVPKRMAAGALGVEMLRIVLERRLTARHLPRHNEENCEGSACHAVTSNTWASTLLKLHSRLRLRLGPNPSMAPWWSLPAPRLPSCNT